MTIPGVAAGKDGRSSGRESKRPFRRPAAHITADGVGGEVGVRGGGVDGVWTPAASRLRIDGGTSLAGGGAGVADSVEPPVVECLPSPPPSAPTGRLADRIRTLRERCRLGLGAETFERAYRYLKVCHRCAVFVQSVMLMILSLNVAQFRVSVQTLACV